MWLWTLAVVAAIYSTLGLARTLAGVLRAGLLAAAFWLGLILIGAAAILHGLKRRPPGAEISGVEISVVLGVVAVYMMVLLRMASPEERSHMIEYSVVALLIYEALMERASHGRRVPVPPLLAVGLASLVGVLDELIQAVLPIRVFDPIDILFNTLAAVMAVSASLALAWARRRLVRKPL